MKFLLRLFKLFIALLLMTFFYVLYNYNLTLVDILSELDIYLLFFILIFIFLKNNKSNILNLFNCYLIAWFFIGNTNYIFFSHIWSGFVGDIILYNKIYLYWIYFFNFFSFILNKFFKNSIDSQDLIKKFTNENRVFFISTILCIAYAVAVTYVTGGGIYFSGLMRDEFFDATLPLGFSRFSSAFIIIAIICTRKFILNNLSSVSYFCILIACIFILTINGTRWMAFQVFATTFFFLLLNNNYKIFGKYKVLILLLVSILVAYQPLIAFMRSAQIDAEDYGFLINTLTTWGGEYRDAAASLMLFDGLDFKNSSSYYLSNLFIPIVPDFFLKILSIDKSIIDANSTSMLMAKAYNIPIGGIRVGGVIESYYWWGYLGVACSSAAISTTIFFVDRLSYRLNRNIYYSVVIPYIVVLVFYFPQSQANVIFPPLASLFSLLVLMKLFDFFILKNEKKYTINF